MKIKFLILLVIFGNTMLSSAVVDKVIAKVNNESILKSEYDKLLNAALEQFNQITTKEQQTPEKIKELKQKVLTQLIEDKLLTQEAKKQKIKVTKRELEDGLKIVKSRFPSDEAFKLELKKENLTEKQFQERIENQVMVLKLIEEQVRKKVVQPTEAEAKEVFNKILKIINTGDAKLSDDEKDEMNLLSKLVQRYFDEQVRVRHILIRVDKSDSKEKKDSARKKIENIKQKIVEGQDFSELAKKYSEDPGSRERDGDLGFIAKGDTVEEFEKVAFSLDEGKVSNIVETQFGYHIIKVIEKKKKRKPNFEDIKQDLLQYVYRKNTEKLYEKYVDSLKKKSSIQTFAPIE